VQGEVQATRANGGIPVENGAQMENCDRTIRRDATKVRGRPFVLMKAAEWKLRLRSTSVIAIIAPLISNRCTAVITFLINRRAGTRRARLGPMRLKMTHARHFTDRNAHISALDRSSARSTFDRRRAEFERRLIRAKRLKGNEQFPVSTNFEPQGSIIRQTIQNDLYAGAAVHFAVIASEICAVAD